MDQNCIIQNRIKNLISHVIITLLRVKLISHKNALFIEQIYRTFKQMQAHELLIHSVSHGKGARPLASRKFFLLEKCKIISHIWTRDEIICQNFVQ